jgi:hypothetical protein
MRRDIGFGSGRLPRNLRPRPKTGRERKHLFEQRALLQLTSDDSCAASQNLDQRSDADIVMICDVPEGDGDVVDDVNVGISQHLDIGRTESNIDETPSRNSVAVGLSSGDRVELRARQLYHVR